MGLEERKRESATEKGQASLEAMLAFACIAMVAALLAAPIAGLSRKGLKAEGEISGSSKALKCAALLNSTHSTGAVFSERGECAARGRTIEAGEGIGIEVLGNARMVETTHGAQVEVEGAEHYE